MTAPRKATQRKGGKTRKPRTWVRWTLIHEMTEPPVLARSLWLHEATVQSVADEANKEREWQHWRPIQVRLTEVLPAPQGEKK